MTTDISAGSVADAAPEPATSGYASAALAFSIVGAVLLGVFCAIAALTEPDTSLQGRREAIAALAISAGWVALVLAAVHGHPM
ncbi:hypothetical protein [Mycobacterium camsae]|uniref:hypothetical protein n=1 Tax=Mycobacterium gordonae TaxID=1778 RepID=UPI0019805FD4|nr:hypothetical protein [Mycobacterium gordonae]